MENINWANLDKFFGYAHLPGEVQHIAMQFHQLATNMLGAMSNVNTYQACMMFQKLLEAKDCAVRSYLNPY